MSNYFRAVALDYDGTLADHRRPDDQVLEAVADVRRAGLKVLLVTGRILSELQDDFPDFREHFDVIVAENGTVLAGWGWTRVIAEPVSAALVAALRARHIGFRRGQVLLATGAEHDVAVLEEIRRLGLDYQLVHNRSELMVLPPAASKGTGMFEALGDLRISYHSTMAIGDAENDHALLTRAEAGVAVANAVPALKEHADLVLEEPDGAGIAALLRGPVLAGKERLHSRRFKIGLGTRSDGRPVELPSSQLNILITGGSRSGKSYFTGLIAEQLVSLGYSVLVADPQGDHRGLAELRGLMMLGGEEPLPTPADLARLLEHRFGSAVVDLSLVSADATGEYLSQVPSAIERLRAATGLPHWVVIDEAHGALGGGWELGALLESNRDGFCLATYRAHELRPEALSATDAILLIPGGDAADLAPFLPTAAALAGVDPEKLADVMAQAWVGQAVLLQPSRPGELVVFDVAHRMTRHVRHWHKYARTRLGRGARFYFRRDWQNPTGAAAANLEEFHHELAHCAPEVLHHHAAHGDFSRWLREVIRNDQLADEVRDAEALRPLEPQLESVRQEILSAIEARYLG